MRYFRHSCCALGNVAPGLLLALAGLVLVGVVASSVPSMASARRAGGGDAADRRDQRPWLALTFGMCHAHEDRIYRELEEPTNLDFIDTPLKDAVEYLSGGHDIPIVLDERSLDRFGLSTETPISIQLSNVSLRSGLNQMLTELDLTFVVQDEVLEITTVERAQTLMKVRVYPVDDLLPDKAPVARSDKSYARADSLIDTITTSIDPDTWNQAGGPGTIRSFGDVLVVGQSEATHAKIGGLLTALRAVP